MPSDTDRDPLDAPIGWIDPKQFNLVWRRMMAYCRQLIANGIRPDNENYSFDVEDAPDGPR
jgi:hypothetical protein